ncbi:MAG: hypothetical protein ABF856_11450 [Acetobacter aceti]|uniref:hypothetical protein n=1 Tax=Acetobacter aceti TaxID=435 RepID=UPI0011EA5442|nr:hypothetical protein [Acetobacter aceti]
MAGWNRLERLNERINIFKNTRNDIFLDDVYVLFSKGFENPGLFDLSTRGFTASSKFYDKNSSEYEKIKKYEVRIKELINPLFAVEHKEIIKLSQEPYGPKYRCYISDGNIRISTGSLNQDKNTFRREGNLYVQLKK